MNQVKGDVNSNVEAGGGGGVEAGGAGAGEEEEEQESQPERGERSREGSPSGVERRREATPEYNDDDTPDYSRGRSRSRSRGRSRGRSRSWSSPRSQEGRGELRRVDGVVEEVEEVEEVVEETYVEKMARMMVERMGEGVSIKEESLEAIAELVAKKVFKLKEEKDDREKVKEARKAGWDEGRDFIICKACTEHSDSEAIPKDLVKSRRGKGTGFGVISKVGANGEMRAGWRLNQAMVSHCELDIHKWCAREEVRVKEVKKTTEEMNREVGTTVILTYLKTARRGGSASDFLDNIDFTHLLPGVEKSTQNNSRQSFFDLRADTMEVVDSKVKELFRDKVTEFSCTLDKVTVQRRSFTVLLTFFFLEGRIFCLLNALISMMEDEYDSAGTAKMVVKTLKASLGMDRFGVADGLVHCRLECETCK